MGERGQASKSVSGARTESPQHPGSVALRKAVRRNAVSFPAQVPVFLRQREAGMQWRAVLLFFVRGWNSPRIAQRFRVPTHVIWQVIEEWSVRAWELGYLQVLDAEAFAACCRSRAVSRTGVAKVRPEVVVHEEAQVAHAAA